MTTRGAATGTPSDADRDTVAPAGWLPWVATGVALVGVADAVYLTIAHFTTSAILACSDTGLVNCARVTTSAQSSILGIPVAVLGLAYFAAMVGINLPWSWRVGGPKGAWLARGRLAGAVGGMGFVVYLVSAELLVIGSICLYCTIIHFLAFVLFVLVAMGSAQRGLGALD